MSQAGLGGPIAALKQRWGALSPRDRVLAASGLAVLALYLLWAIAIAPALATLRQAPLQLAALQAQEQQMQAQAQAANALRHVAPLAPAAATQALQAASTRLGPQARLSLQGDRAVLTVQAVAAPQLVAWLAEVRAGARARVTEATLTQAGPGSYSGSITLAIGSGA